MKAWKRILLSLILALSLSSTGIQAVQAETSGQSTEQFANLVLFVQFKDTAEANFMDHLQNYTATLGTGYCRSLQIKE